MISLRPYQQQFVETIRSAFRDGHRRVCAVAPTGSGKTVCFAYITHHASAKGNRVLILTHRGEILEQISKALRLEGCDHGIIQSGQGMNMLHPVQVASVQTLRNRFDLVKEPDLIVCDEFHHFRSKTFQEVLEHWPNAKVLGVTATPARLDGKGLHEVSDHMVFGPTVKWLIDGGYLARPSYFAPSEAIDLKGIRKVAGDYNQAQLADRMGQSKITGDAVSHYHRICPNEQAIVFCVLLWHSEKVCEAFRASGVSAESIDGKMTKQERAAVMSRFRSGETRVLTSVDLIGEGVDVPAVGAAILLRPTQSLGLYLQQVGRALRPSPGKTRAVILDHAGNCLKHGLAEFDREWTLADGVKRKSRNGVSETKQCPKCYCIYASIEERCPECGHSPTPEARTINEVGGFLLEMTEADKMALQNHRRDEVRSAKTMDELIALGKKRGYRYPTRWAGHVLGARMNRKEKPVFA